MLKLYGRPEMSGIWSDRGNFYHRLLVEVAVLKARRSLGEFDHEIPAGIIEQIKIEPESIECVEYDSTDMAGFLEYFSKQFPPELEPWLHKDLANEDVCETALSLQLKASADILLQDAKNLMAVIKAAAFAHKHVPQIGRTHGIHTEHITFGVKLANWYAEIGRHQERLHRLAKTVSRGKISGAVGMYAIDPRIERLVCEDLGLEPTVSTQIIARDIVGEYLACLALIAASLGKFALNLRLLSQTEISEIMEPTEENLKLTAARLPVKIPADCENLTSLVRIVYANAQVAYENLAHNWHERSMDNSGSERLAIIESSVLVDYIIDRLAKIIRDMQVFPQKMLKNIGLTKDLLYSPEVTELVAEKSGLSTEEVRGMVKEISLKSWEEESSFIENLLAHPVIGKHVSWTDIHHCFKFESKLRHVDYIFEMVFGKQD